MINFPKSSLVPAQTFKFLGLVWNTVSGVVSIVDQKRLAMTTKAAAMAAASQTSCRTLFRLVSHMSACLMAVPLLCLHCRYLQRDLKAVYSLPHHINKKVTISPKGRRDLHWTASLELSPQRLPPRGIDGRIGLCMGDLFSRSDASWALDIDNCRCPSPYQCQGDGCVGGVPLGLPSPVRGRMQAALEDGQHHGAVLHSPRRWHDISPSS